MGPFIIGGGPPACGSSMETRGWRLVAAGVLSCGIRMRRVAHVSHSSQLGGERVLLRLLASLDRSRTEPLLVLPAPGPLGDAAEAIGIRVRVSPLSWWIPATHWGPQEFAAQARGLVERVAAL